MNSTDRPSEGSSGRGGERRQKDRRRLERRTPLPPWRQPWAYVAYGVTGALVLFLILSWGDDPEVTQPPHSVETMRAGPAIDTTRPVAANAPVEDAYGTGGFERLLAAGEAAVGQRVRTTLFCDQIRSVGLRSGDGVTANRSIAESADAASRVPAAECRWGPEGSAAEILLIVPPALAERFASMPEVERAFVRRREVSAEVEWIGRSEALALRNVAVLRAIR